MKKTVNEKERIFGGVYDNLSVKELKHVLKSLKTDIGACSRLPEISFVSRLIRTRLKDKKRASVATENVDQDLLCRKHFWKFVKKVFRDVNSSLPTFNISTCYLFFSKTLSLVSSGPFPIPSWIPPLSFAGIPTPSYGQVAKAIRYARVRSSSCPLDQMSFLALKKTPILGSILHVIILNCWRERRIPAIWKRGVTVLIHKRGDTSDPANYRPITLQNCWYKIFSKVYASSIFEFLSKNKFIDTEYQKGFWRGVDGVLEHTEVLEQMLKSAKKERRNIIICLLDFKNAFGEVPHALLKSTLLHHHLPPEIIEIFDSIYSKNMLQVSLVNNLTPPPH